MTSHALKLPNRLLPAVLAICALAAGGPQVRAQNDFTLTEETFNQWLYRNGNGKVEQKAELTLNVDAIDRACHLDNDQKAKLQLAAAGDYARFNQEVDQLRADLVGKTYNQNEMGNVYQKISPLSERCQQGMLGETSLFTKVVHRVLTPEQVEEYEASELDRRKARHEAKCRLFVAIFEQSCPLTAKQRDAMTELILQKTKPAKRKTEYDWYVVMYQVSKIPEKEMGAILDKSQMKILKGSTQQARGLEAHLKSLKVLPD